MRDSQIVEQSNLSAMEDGDSRSSGRESEGKENVVTPSERTKNFGKELGSAVLAGSLHALLEQPVVIPIEATITQTQINGRNFFVNFSELLSRKQLYRSLPTALAGAVPKSIIHYSILTFYANALAPEGDIQKAKGWDATKIGMAVGATEVALTNPINFVKFRMQRPEWGYTGMMNAITTIYRTEGPAAFWKGTGFVFLRNSICNGGMVGGFRFFDDLLEQRVPEMFSPPVRHLVAGSLGGLIGSFISYPFEMMRAAAQHNVSFYHEMFSQGPRRLLAGWFPGACRLILTSAIMGSIIPRLKGFSDEVMEKFQGDEEY